jgi:DhnA family fructose-bisphosphate aldolase class Ia
MSTTTPMDGRCPPHPRQLRSDNPGTKANLARILMQGRLGGTGKLVILPVDQGSNMARRAASP